MGWFKRSSRTFRDEQEQITFFSKIAKKGRTEDYINLLRELDGKYGEISVFVAELLDAAKALEKKMSRIPNEIRIMQGALRQEAARREKQLEE
jgi:hypothetical protein